MVCAGMGSLAPIAFDIETSGLGDNAEITVAGLAHELGEVIILNTAGRTVAKPRLASQLEEHSVGRVNLHALR